MRTDPLVSVVTPFYNTKKYLVECVESVLQQSYHNWEYILVDNCSSDGSSEVVQYFTQRYSEKIRLVQTKTFLTQAENYNYALTLIAPESKYCKVVQADDWLFPECISQMVGVAEAHPSVAIVSAYELAGNMVDLEGVPYSSSEITGREACRLYYLDGKYLFGTPTSLLIRSDIVRKRVPFYEEKYAPFEDAHACFDLFRYHNLGFVHQLLTYSRRDQESILTQAYGKGLYHFFRLSVVVAHGAYYLSTEEYKRCLKNAERRYYLYLSRCAMRGRNREFWNCHKKCLASIGYDFSWFDLVRWVPRAFVEKTWETFWLHWDMDSYPASDEYMAG
jgi:glycosyltransferase involved in cell wall biosynthesis